MTEFGNCGRAGRRGRTRALRFASAAALVTAVAACGDDSPDGDASDVPPTVSSVATQMIAATGSGVGVVAGGCGLAEVAGSGAVVERVGQVVTVAHTLRGAETVRVVDVDGDDHAATVVAFDKDADLAVLDAPDLDVPALPLGRAATGRGTALVWDRAEGVRAIDLEITRRLLVTIEDIYIDEIVERDAIEVAADIEVGDSGGAILDTDGDVVGVVYATSRQREGVGFAVAATEVADVLDGVTGAPVDTGRCP